MIRMADLVEVVEMDILVEVKLAEQVVHMDMMVELECLVQWVQLIEEAVAAVAALLVNQVLVVV